MFDSDFLSRLASKALDCYQSDKDDLPGFIRELALYIMQNSVIDVGEHRYQIVETEMYYWSDCHQDIYTHRTTEQGNFCTWYFNGFGLDLTVGNSQYGVEAGLLIRGVKNIAKNEYFSGPTIVLKELFRAIGNAYAPSNSIALKAFASAEKTEIISSVRIGLPQKDIDFRGRPYRYISDLNVAHKFADKYSVIKACLTEEMDIRIDIQALGYYIRKT
ncbi:MAG: hypothetical protein JNL57_10765 [Bacteroidetes bacterium]|nr:hypothetical protein [Bacteroidota bacterium]